MSNYKIEKNIPIPPNPAGAPEGACKYPWLYLDVGDSFFIPEMKISSVNPYAVSKKYGLKFAKRTVDGGVRVWRIK